MKLYRKDTAAASGLDRRAFLQRSGLALGGAALAASLPAGMMRRADAAQKVNPPQPGIRTELRRSVCTHCSVGCGVVAEVQNGVWTGQEPDFDSPINLGAHCAKGASVREHGHGERRLKYPMKLVGGRWKRISWDQAIDEIGDKLLAVRAESGPDALFFCGSSKCSNEQAYLQRKFAAFWGSNNCDHQARICHSTTVAGVANTWGYGAMTSSYNDMHQSKCIMFIGSNAAEAHPISMQHVLRGKENGAKIIVVDPRFTRTAAHADIYVSLRAGTDIPFIWGLLWHIFKNGWEDREYIRRLVYGMDAIRGEVRDWTPERVTEVTGVSSEQVHRVAETLAQNRPGSLVWCMGGTQHHIGNSFTRAYCILQLALGNIGMPGGGADIFRGHDNVQGATDVGPNSDSLPAYFGLSEDAWRHWARVWNVDFDWLEARFDPGSYADHQGNPTPAMYLPGIPVSRWIDGVLADPSELSQRSNFRVACFQGHAVNSLTRGPEIKQALEKLEMLVINDLHPTHAAVLPDRSDGIYLLPAASQFETCGSVTASNRSLQWRFKVIEPMFESLPDHVVLYRLARKLGFADEMFRNIQVNGDEPLIEDVLREINRGSFSVGYSGQSPERLKLHAEQKHTFNTTTLKAEGGPCDGEYYGLPWPCWGTPEMKHPGSPILYDYTKPVAEGGGTFRARFGVERDGESLLADGMYTPGSEIRDGYPEFSADLLKQLGWWDDLTPEEKAEAEGRNWKTDLSGGIQRVAIRHGCSPYGNAKARCIVWNFPDPIPKHREPLYSPRRDMVERYPTYQDVKSHWRVPIRYASIQQHDHSRNYPLVFISGRLTEYEGGGEETRSNHWLAELQQEMFVEIHPGDANDRGIRDGEWVWLEGPAGAHIRIKAMVTRRVPRGTVWTPFHFGGWYQGQDLIGKYPEGAAPYVRGEACNTATTYGYDPVTQMQETKPTLCQVRRA
jgi:formate dehydrogenase major subunit